MAAQSLVDRVRAAWIDWPEISEEEMDRYKSGAIDLDPSMAIEASQITSLDVAPIDSLLVWFAGPALYQRVCGCACFQLASILEFGHSNFPDIIAFVAFDLCSDAGDFEYKVLRQSLFSQEQINLLEILLDEFVTRGECHGPFELNTEYAAWNDEEILIMAEKALDVEKMIFRHRFSQ